MRSFTSPAARAAGPLLFAPVTFALLALGFSQSFAENEGDEVYSLPPIVVVADLAETPADQVGSSVTTITREEIERSQKNSVLDLLREVPGLDVVRSGGPGGQTSVFMRGGASEHTLVLVDGVEMNDPSSPNGAYDFAGLSAENIERIEILRGAQSALYGSDAIGGVISFITREATGDQRPSFAAEVGGFNTYRASAGFSSSSARVSYTLNVSRFATKGISATSASGQAPVERDGFGRSAVSGRLRYSLSPQVTARLSLRAFESTAELDKSFASFSSGVREDPNLTADTRQAFLSSSVEYESPDRRWRLTGYATVSRHERETVDLPDKVFGPDASNSFFDGEQVKFRLLARGQVFPSHRIVAGVETERELTSQHLLGPFPAFLGGVSARTSGVFVSDRLAVAERLFVSAGIRYDNHETFGGKTTYRVSASYAVEESGTRFRASFATGFNAPGIFQLFDPSFGNTDLRAEESKSWEVGVDQSTLGDRLNFGALWFKADFTDLFGFDPNTFQTVNINESEAEGAEAFAQYTYTNLSARLDYTYTRAVDNSDGAQLIRRPRNKVSGRVTLRPSDRFAASLSVTHIGSRADLDFDSFPSVRVRLDPYTLVTLGGSIELSDLWRVSGRVENLFDEDYQEALFFGAPGRALYLGARLTP